MMSLTMNANVRLYDHLRRQRDSVSGYTKVSQSDTACNLMPGNLLYTLLATVIFYSLIFCTVNKYLPIYY
jgi:hypothetical protein